MNNLYPELPDEAAEKANELISQFKDELRKSVDGVLGDLYVDVTPFIESDHWSNYRQKIITAIRGYSNESLLTDYELKDIRLGILRKHREEIINQLNQDLVKENNELKEQLNQQYNIY